MRSLTLKLTLAFLVVALVGSVVVVALTRIQTQRELDRFMLSVYQTETYADIVTYYQNNGSWDGIAHEPEFNQHGPYGRHYYDQIMIVDTDNRVVLGPDEYYGGLVRFNKRLSIPIEVNGETVGWLIVANTPMKPGSPEADFLGRMNNNILISG